MDFINKNMTGKSIENDPNIGKYIPIIQTAESHIETNNNNVISLFLIGLFATQDFIFRTVVSCELSQFN